MEELNQNEIETIHGGIGVLSAIAISVMIYEFGKGVYDGINS